MNDRFGLNDTDKDRSKALIYKLQAVRTRLQYEGVLAKVRTEFPNPLSPGTDNEEFAADNLGAIILGSSDMLTCPFCASRAGRDENAALNILCYVCAGSLQVFE
jgi:hypothetical protein